MNKKNKSKKVKITMRLTFWEYSIISWEAENAKLSKSKYCRSKILKGSESDMNELKELIIEMDHKLSSLSPVEKPQLISIDTLKIPITPKIPLPHDVPIIPIKRKKVIPINKERITTSEIVKEIKNMWKMGTTLLNRMPEEELDEEQKERLNKYIKMPKEQKSEEQVKD